MEIRDDKWGYNADLLKNRKRKVYIKKNTKELIEALIDGALLIALVAFFVFLSWAYYC